MSDEKRYATENTALGANSLAEVIKDWLAIDGSKFCLKVTNFILKIFENWYAMFSKKVGVEVPPNGTI